MGFISVLCIAIARYMCNSDPFIMDPIHACMQEMHSFHIFTSHLWHVSGFDVNLGSSGDAPAARRLSALSVAIELIKFPGTIPGELQNPTPECHITSNCLYAFRPYALPQMLLSMNYFGCRTKSYAVAL